MLLHGIDEALNLGLDFKAFPGVHQQRRSYPIIHVHLTQYPFVRMTDLQDLFAHRVFKRHRGGAQAAQKRQPLPLQGIFRAGPPCPVIVVLQNRGIDPDLGGVLHSPLRPHRVAFDVKHRAVKRQVLFTVQVVQPQAVSLQVAGQPHVLHKLTGRVVPQADFTRRLSHGRHRIPQGLAQPLGICRMAHTQNRALMGL